MKKTVKGVFKGVRDTDQDFRKTLKSDPDLKKKWDEMQRENKILLDGFRTATEAELNILKREYQSNTENLLKEAHEKAEELEAIFASRKRAFLEEHFP